MKEITKILPLNEAAKFKNPQANMIAQLRNWR